MLTYTKPAERSTWSDNVLNIGYTVLGVEGEDVLVHCQHGPREWTDVLHISLFGTELVPS
jgi:hypothetical protein